MIKLTKDNILTLYKIMVDNTGGTIGIRDTSLLESALNAPFQTFGDEELYPSIIEKASRLCYGLIKNHPFIDGNKRIGVYAMLVYLGLNNINLNFSDEEIINIALKTADSSYSYEDILGILKVKEIL
jgi:death-on-curing protein